MINNLLLQTILFTTDENILEMVSKNDSAFECDMPGDDEEDVPFERPSTANAEDEVSGVF